MFLVSEIWNEARKVFRHCDDETLYDKISDGIELLANKGEIDPLVGYVDLCVTSQCLTFPREVETVLAINLDGHPAISRNPLFSFHLNGPGDFSTRCDSWTDVGQFPTYRDLPCPGKLIAFLDNSEDNGKKLTVFGFDDQNRPLRTKVNNVWQDGLIVPTIFGFALPAASDPIVSRITAIVKDRTVANIRLSSFDNSTTTGILLGIFEPDETKPLYRRVKLGKCSDWARVHFRKKTFRLSSQNDRILLHSRLALVLAMRSIQFWDDTDAANATLFEAHATRILTEKESVLNGPAQDPIQVDDRNSIKNPGYDEIE